MKIVLVLIFVLMATFVAGQDALQRCIQVAEVASNLNPGGTCAYIEDAVRCGINDLGLADDNAKQEDIESGRTWANQELSDNGCSTTFDDILNEVKANPKLLELQGCIDTAIRSDAQEGSKNPCSHIEDGVRCAIRVGKLQEENASQDEVMYVKQVAERYLSPYGCTKTFDGLLTEVKNSSPAVSPVGWFTAVMVGFIVMFTAV